MEVGELLPQGEFAWPRAESEQISTLEPEACNHGGHGHTPARGGGGRAGVYAVLTQLKSWGSL